LLSKTNSRNYIISRTYKQSGADPNDVSKVVTQIQYLDGLGRPLQNVTVGQSPSGNDFIQPLEYDAAGRVSKNYLPYVAAGKGAFQNNAANNAASWYTANPANLNPSDLGRPFQEATFEKSPTSRTVAERAPGNKSANSLIKHKISVAGQVNRYDYDPAANTIIQVGQYAAGMLKYVNITDEQGNVTNEFTDLLGQMICRQVITASSTLTTHYVFDDFGLLRAVLQPAYQDFASLTDNAFIYDYDEQRRLIVKKIPGGALTEMVYDQFHRLVASRDANQLARGVWAFIKYDALDRPVVTGEISSPATRTTWATNVAAIPDHHEERSDGTIAGYTLNKTGPTNASEANLLTITFYDDYAFSKAANLSYNAAYYPSNNANVKGQITGGRTRMLPGNGAAGGWLTNATYYDVEYRPIQTIRELYDLGAGSIERASTQYKYDLAAVVSELKTEQLLTGNVTNTHLATYSYDHADRLLSVKEKVTSGANVQEAITVAQRYNALGQLQSKWFHSADATKFRLRTDYTNNIRGWLTDAKTVYKKEIIGPDLSYFGYNLGYANGANYTNGNISQMQWLNKDDAAFTKGLTFTYDGANRLLGSAGLMGYADIESGIGYDKNGNIKTLIRAGTAIDNLVCAYLGNRLSAVTDASGSNLGVKNGISSYGYDANGNMISDGNRNATLTYNYLNLPKTVTIGGKTLTYDYDAAGTKHKYIADTVTFKYAGAFEYRQVGAANVLDRVALSEGQAVFRKGALKFEYSLKDHLGNVRVVFDEFGQVLQRTDYYPFGLEIDRNTPSQPLAARNNVNRFLYNGKELQVGTAILDYGARMYIPEIGRWGMVDPLSEKMPAWSPHTYGFNNPIRFIDPLGLSPSTHTDEDGNVVAVYDDGDLGVYKHSGSKAEAEKAVKTEYSRNNTDAGGEKMGESLHTLSFANQSLYNETNFVRAARIKIDFGSTVLTGRVQGIINSDPSVIDYFNRAGSGGDWDIKAHVSNGSLLYGRYASPRDAGNFAAGALAQSSGIEPIVQYGFGAYNLTGNSKSRITALTVGVGLLTRMNPALGLGTAYLIGKYGEDKLSQRSIDIGKEFIRRRR
jgi:RHS repeat-associated protein